MTQLWRPLFPHGDCADRPAVGGADRTRAWRGGGAIPGGSCCDVPELDEAKQDAKLLDQPNPRRSGSSSAHSLRAQQRDGTTDLTPQGTQHALCEHVDRELGGEADEHDPDDAVEPAQRFAVAQERTERAPEDRDC